MITNLDYFTPELIEQLTIKNQNLHALRDVDYAIITPVFLSTQAELLANYHREKGLIVEVIDLEHIYNEFYSGSPDLTAIRDFTKHLYDNATSTDKKIKHLCLFGDVSYHYKDRREGNNNTVPVFESFRSFSLVTSYVTDDYYGMMDENEGLLKSSDRQDVTTGRILVSNPLQASEVVTKILNYYSTDAFGDWRNQLVLIVDDIDDNGDEIS